MRVTLILLTCLALTGALSAVAVEPASADPGPWCRPCPSDSCGFYREVAGKSFCLFYVPGLP